VFKKEEGAQGIFQVNMPYVGSDGQVVEKRPFGFSMIVNYFWGVVNFANLFFRGLFHMDDPGTQRGQYGNNAGGRSQRIPGRRTIGGIRSSGGAAPPPCVGGG